MQGGRQSHVGRGPKGYRRSDERIEEEVNEQLTRHPEIDPSEVEVRVRNGEVTLTGTVDERRTKRMVEDLVEGISGVNEVHNQIRVNRGGSSGGSSGSSDREVSRGTEREGSSRESTSGSESKNRGKAGSSGATAGSSTSGSSTTTGASTSGGSGSTSS